MEMRYTFRTEREPLVKDPIFISGINRAGKTIFSNIVASFENMEYEFEPWLFINLPLLEEEGLIETKTAIVLLQGQADELLINHILGRNINLRESDMSKKDNFLDMEELKERWTNIKDREDVRNYVKKNNRKLLLHTVNLNPYLDLTFKAFPDVKIIHLLRNPFDIALSNERKGPISDEFLKNNEMTDMRKIVKIKDQKVYLPWWVKEKDIERFRNYSNYERCLMFCRWMIKEFLDFKKTNPKLLKKENYIEIKYETFLQNPQLVLKELEFFLKEKPTKHMEKALKTIKSNNLYRNKDYRLNEIAEKDLKETLDLMEEIGYDVESFIKFAKGEDNNWAEIHSTKI